MRIKGKGQHGWVEAGGEESLRGRRCGLLNLVKEVREDLDSGNGVGEGPVCERVGGHGCLS